VVVNVAAPLTIVTDVPEPDGGVGEGVDGDDEQATDDASKEIASRKRTFIVTPFRTLNTANGLPVGIVDRPPLFAGICALVAEPRYETAVRISLLVRDRASRFLVTAPHSAVRYAPITPLLSFADGCIDAHVLAHEQRARARSSRERMQLHRPVGSAGGFGHSIGGFVTGWRRRRARR